jgi:hypothetical protein
MVYVIKQVGKDLYFRCTAEGHDLVSFGEASISRYDMTVSTTMDRLRRDEERRKFFILLRQGHLKILNNDKIPTLKLHFSCPKFTVKLTVREGTIVEAAPFVRRFEGQKLANLVSWAKTTFRGPLVIQVLEEEQKPSLAQLLEQVIKEYKGFENARTYKPPRHRR